MPSKPIQQDSITGIWDYLLSIDWEEPWLWILISFHLWCSAATVLVIVYNKYYPQIGLFTSFLGFAFCSQYINDWAAKNYKLFSREQYFDSQGMFISLLFSFPLLCNALVIVVYWLYDVTQTMINLKRTKVRLSQKAAKRKADLESKETDAQSTTDSNDKSEVNKKDEDEIKDTDEKVMEEQVQVEEEGKEKSSVEKKED